MEKPEIPESIPGEIPEVIPEKQKKILRIFLKKKSGNNSFEQLEKLRKRSWQTLDKIPGEVSKNIAGEVPRGIDE